MNKIIRIFPRKTRMTPIDNYSFIGSPCLFIPEHTEIHISVLFTWDIEKAYELKSEWELVTNKPVKIGGPALNTKADKFIPGKYIDYGITITSRGCPNKCKYCFVPKREEKIKELDVVHGNIIQDNNILACSNNHLQKVFSMLKKEKRISFKGLESRRITSKIADELRGLKIYDLWLACDEPKDLKPLKKAVQILKKAGFNQNKLRCYVLIGDDFKENEDRLREVYNIGCLPFSQLFQPEKEIIYSKEWKRFNRLWSRPAAYKNYIKNHKIKVM